MHGPSSRGRDGVVVVVVWWLCVVSSLWFAVAAGGRKVQQQGGTQALPVCRGLHRAEVDWWVMLKHPGGYQYSYVDSVSSSDAGGSCAAGLCWRHGLSMQNPNPVSHTLEVLTSPAATAAAADSLAYAIYNDADPAGTEHFDFAHAKGVVAFTDAAPGASSSGVSSAAAGGFWLGHSAPRFPGLPGQQPDWMQLQHPQSVFGQHFSCCSLADSSSIAAVADVLLAAGPFVYSSHLPAHLAGMYPGWRRVLSGAFDTGPATVNASLSTAAGQQLRVFAKSSLLTASLTDAVVGPGLGVDLLWETWRRSHDALPSVCPSPSATPAPPGGSSSQQQQQQQSNTSSVVHSSLNIAEVAFRDTPYRWSWSRDHSKWGVSSSSTGSSNSDLLFVCLGDLNRAGWQAHRGGSYVCLQHAGLWQAFHAILAAAESCVWRT